MTIRVGIGGWTFEPWRGVFYPEGLPHAKELSFAGARLKTIEINGTFYRTPSAKSCADWARQVPDGFVFALKATRYVTHRRVLAEAEESIGKFIASGITEMGDRLGPINWQFAPTKAFDPDDFAAFLALLPGSHAGVRLRHAVEVRHPSFASAEFIALARKHEVAIVYADHDSYPAIADVTADFAYARLQRTQEEVETGYDDAALAGWAKAAVAWEKGSVPEGLPAFGVAIVYADHDSYPAIADVTADFAYARLQRTQEEVETGYDDAALAGWAKAAVAWEKGSVPEGLPAFGPAAKTGRSKRDVFIYLISGAKVRNPAGAIALQARLDAGA